MKPPENEIGPWNFDSGTPAWTAAMLELQKKRERSEVHVRINVNIVHVGGDTHSGIGAS